MRRSPGSPHSKKQNHFPAKNQHESFTGSLQSTAPSNTNRSRAYSKVPLRPVLEGAVPQPAPRKRRGSGPSGFCVRGLPFSSAANRKDQAWLYSRGAPLSGHDFTLRKKAKPQSSGGPGSPHSKKRNPFPAENQHESFTDSLQSTAPSRFGRSSPSNRPRKRRGSGPSRFCVRTRLFSAGNRTRSSRLFKPSSAWSRPGIERPGPAVEMQNSHRKMVNKRKENRRRLEDPAREYFERLISCN